MNLTLLETQRTGFLVSRPTCKIKNTVNQCLRDKKLSAKLMSVKMRVAHANVNSVELNNFNVRFYLSYDVKITLKFHF